MARRNSWRRSVGPEQFRFDEDTDTLNPGKMTFTEHNATNGSPYGLDDFQDGWGCGDNWSPQQHRGSSAFIMIR